MSFSVVQHIKDFSSGFHWRSTDGIRPNWMMLRFINEEKTKEPLVVVIDHKNEDARRGLGALIHHIFVTAENWEIRTNRQPNCVHFTDVTTFEGAEQIAPADLRLGT